MNSLPLFSQVPFVSAVDMYYQQCYSTWQRRPSLDPLVAEKLNTTFGKQLMDV